MPILRERVEWSRPRKPRSPELSLEEQASAKLAVRFLRARLGSWATLAERTSLSVAILRHTQARRARITANVALRIARAAGVPLEDILRGAWPGNACPTCGHVTEGGSP
jgi:hypothetical protein